MANKVTKPFYNSDAWKRCRESYIKQVNGLCEDCMANGIVREGDEVHHLIELDETNINNPYITLDFNNLVLLCHDCHNARHKRYQKRKRRYAVDDYGNVYTIS